MSGSRRSASLGATLAVCVLSGCTARLQTFEGEYRRGFEQHTLRPCRAAADERSWWIVMSFGADSVAAAAASQYAGEVLHARFRGRVSEKGSFGHLGQSSRVLHVDAVEEIRPRRAGDCAPVPVIELPGRAPSEK